jgi:hypothetical protein
VSAADGASKEAPAVNNTHNQTLTQKKTGWVHTCHQCDVGQQQHEVPAANSSSREATALLKKRDYQPNTAKIQKKAHLPPAQCMSAAA